jgi:tetratricopeptide (TPR) repeat protein
MSSQVETVSAAKTATTWIYRPWLDLLVGCGAWSAPLLAVAAWMTTSHTHGFVVAFYFLAVVFNYPHFMATVYRAYHTREDFAKYKFFTLHLTLLLVATGVLAHTFSRVVPWVFTLYICWSPWHYSGQNYGLMMMFVRRAGASVTEIERRWLRAAFITSYLMLLASFETAGSSDPLILSLGLPARFTFAARIALGAAFLLCSAMAYRRLLRANGLRRMVAPLTLVVTQFLWFVLPTLLELRAAYQIPQTRYSSGILAVLHSAQYLWITSYYQRREARAAGQSDWRMAGYFLTLVAGGIALFIPGPWVVSYIFHFDFTTSFLIFTALVNIHHFILDGALWKLRDSRIAGLLIGTGKETESAGTAGVRWLGGRVLGSPAFRVSVVALLFLWGGLDQFRFALGTSEGNLIALSRAAKINPYDSSVEQRIASVHAAAGHHQDAIESLTRAVEINPHSVALQQACALALIEDGRYAEAYGRYREMLKMFPRDPDSLVNYGLIAARLGHPEEAADAWQRAIEADPGQTNAHLYLAEYYDQKAQPAAAARHWYAFLHNATAQVNGPPVTQDQAISALVQLSDDEAQLSQTEAAATGYRSAVSLADRAGDARLGSLALAHLADLEEKTGDVRSAADSRQRGLALDAKARDAQSEALDWFNYGQFLRRHGSHDDLTYACFLRAESLLGNPGGQPFVAVQTARQEVERRLGGKATGAKKNLSSLLADAAKLPATSFE